MGKGHVVLGQVCQPAQLKHCSCLANLHNIKSVCPSRNYSGFVQCLKIFFGNLVRYLIFFKNCFANTVKRYIFAFFQR